MLGDNKVLKYHMVGIWRFAMVSQGGIQRYEWRFGHFYGYKQYFFMVYFKLQWKDKPGNRWESNN